MDRDPERVERITAGLQKQGLDGLVCALPNHVLLLSGYWPVIGISLALATRDGRIVLLVPEDEEELARGGWADEVRTFQAGSLQDLRTSKQIVGSALAGLLATAGFGRGGALGYEDDEASVPASYSALHVFGSATRQLLQETAPQTNLSPAAELLGTLKASLTPGELNRLRAACDIANAVFLEGAKGIAAGLKEPMIAGLFQSLLAARGLGFPGVARAGGWAWCMSGPNSARASGAYARTRNRELKPGDLVLVHCNSYADGFWTDITRTFCLGPLDSRQERICRAVLDASRAALDVIQPGVTGADVDRAARELLSERGFAKEFKHGAGHGVGFAAISHQARPRLHPLSPDILETGMVFNVEPAIYIDGYGGWRHCAMVALGEHGPEELTPVQQSIEELTLPTS